MNEPVELTIVIPARNRAELLPRTLQSVERQTLRPLDVILVDNGSTDHTLAVMHEWAARPHGINVRVLSEDAPGAAAARNRGLSEVRTEWTMFFDSDDTMEPEHCRRALACAGNADMVGWNVRYHVNGKSSVKKFYVGDAQFHSLFHGSTATQRYMARTVCFVQAGAWNADVFYWNDIELGARMLAGKPRVRHAGNEITVDVFTGEDSITGNRYSDRVVPARKALEAIAGTLGQNRSSYVDLKAVILAGDCTREGSPSGKELLAEVLGRNSGIFRRAWLRAAYIYQSAGGRGTARLFRILL